MGLSCGAMGGVLFVGALACAACTSDGSAQLGESSTFTTTVLRPLVQTPPSTEQVSTTSPSTTVNATTTTQPQDTPEIIAAALTEAERGIRDVTLAPDQTATWGRAQQRAYRTLRGHPEWDDAVRALLPADVASAFDANVAARRAVVAHAASRPPVAPPATLPAWTIVDPLPVDELLGYYHEAEAATGVAWAYLAAINFIETGMGRIEGVSSAGAVGPMQFLPTTWESCCFGNVLDPRDAIMGAATFLVAHGAPTDMTGALYRYNPNDGYVGAATAYAQNLLNDERAVYGYHAWEVYVATAAGTVRLPLGYSQSAPVDAATYIAEHPDDLAPVSD